MLLLFLAAHASCAMPRPTTTVPQQTLGPTTPLFLRSSWGTAAELAARVRVRAPDGTLVQTTAWAHGDDVRLVPTTTWPVGSLTLEERAAFDTDGLRTQFVPHHTAWFAVQRLQGLESPPPTASLHAAAVEYSRTARHGHSSLVTAALDLPAGTRWVDLEIEGMGTIRRQLTQGTRVQIPSIQGHRCSCSPRGSPLPTAGLLRARVVLYADGGVTTATPWTGLPGDDLWGSWTSAILPDPARWLPLQVEPDTRPTRALRAACPSLVLDESQTTPSSGDVILDGEGDLRHVESDPFRIDGRPYPGITDMRALGGEGDDVYAVVGTRELSLVHRGPQHRGEVPLERTGGVTVHVETDVRVTTSDATGTWQRHYTKELDAKGPWRATSLHPPAHYPTPTGLVRGPTHTAFQTTVNDTPTLVLMNDQGEVAWERPLPADTRVDRTVVDREGVVLQARVDGVPQFLAWTTRGTPRIESALPTVRPENARPFGELDIVGRGRAWVVVDDAGHRSVPLHTFGVTAVESDRLHVARVWKGTRYDEFYRCEEADLGIPDGWAPRPSSHGPAPTKRDKADW